MGKRGNGEGTVYERPNGTWAGLLTIGRDENGKLKRLSFSGKSQKEVLAKIAKAKADLLQGTFVEPSKLTLGAWLDTWLEEYVQPHARRTTWDNYHNVVEAYVKPTLGKVLLRELRPDHLQKLYNDLLAGGRRHGEGGLSHRTVRLVHVVLHAALKQALENQLVGRNVAEATKPPRPEKHEARALTPEETEKFLAAIGEDRLRAAYILDLTSGLRRGELLALTWKDVDLKEGVIYVNRTLVRATTLNGPAKTTLTFQEPKTKSGRRAVPIPEDVLPELKAHKARQAKEKLFLGEAYQDTGLVFCREDGSPLPPDQFSKAFKEAAKAAGITGATLHSLRHTYATRLMEANEHPKVVQELLGHSNISITLDTYTHVMPDLKRAAAAKLTGLLAKKKSPSAKEGD